MSGPVRARNARVLRALRIAVIAVLVGGVILRWVLLVRFAISAFNWPVNVVARTLLPGEAFTLTCLVASVAAGRRKHLAQFFFAAVGIGGQVYGAVIAASAAVAEGMYRARPAWHLLSWPALVAGLVLAALLGDRFARISFGSGRLPAVPARGSVGSAAIPALISYAAIWAIWIGRARFERPLGYFDPRLGYVADGALVACLAWMYVALGLRRSAGYLFGLATCGALVVRSLHFSSALALGTLTRHWMMHLIAWPYLAAGLIATASLWNEFRLQAVRFAADTGGTALGLSVEPIIPPRLAELLGRLFNASGIPALVRAWDRLWVHGIWRVAKGEKVHTWSQIIFGAQGRAEDLFLDAATFIEGTHIPDVRMRRNTVTPTVVRGLFGVRREFLTVTPVGNARLERYCMYLGARDYGDALDVYWYVVHRPAWWERLLVLIAFVPVLNFIVLPILLVRLAHERRGSLDLDFFDESDLSACVTVAHHCVVDAAKKLMASLNQDPNKLVTTTKGFLGIA